MSTPSLVPTVRPPKAPSDLAALETAQAVTIRESGRRPVLRNHLTLIINDDDAPFRLAPIRVDEAVVGRGEEADVIVHDGGVSRMHARFFLRDGDWHVEDLDSQNGTLVGDEPLVGIRAITGGDEIHIGTQCTIRVLFDDEKEQAAAADLYHAATCDPLTKTYNRRYLQARLEQELAFARRHATRLSVLILDLDHFKAVNDTHGHLAGDLVLRLAGATLSRIVRTEDVVARYGGEEFVVLARGIDHRNAQILADRLRRALASLRIPWKEQYIEVTASVGVATQDLHHGYETVDALLGVADRGLYEAKLTGRNRCVSVERTTLS
jgi:diguanylate cyclase (GGDEF)-like protein